MRKERFQSARAEDAFFDFLNFSLRQFFPARPNGSIVLQTIEKEFDLTQGKTHIAREADEEDAADGLVRIAALATGTVWGGEKSKCFVVADRGRFQAGAAREFSNLHFRPPSEQNHLDLKSALTFSIVTRAMQVSPGGETMCIENQPFARDKRRRVAEMALALLLSAAVTTQLHGQNTSATMNTEKKAMTGSKFYCNIKALNPVERARHKDLTDKLIAARKEIVETEKGYEFQYGPSSISLSELADWVAAESKCCPFFEFHIDLEREGILLCLRLTGEDGIKPFIRSEFQVPANERGSAR